MESVETLNKRLRELYGLFEDGRPNFRISMSDQIEVHKGKFKEYTESGIFLREWEGIKECPKYPWIDPPKFVLERLSPTGAGDKELTLTTVLSYEPLYIFSEGGNEKGLPLEPDWEVIEFILASLYHRVPKIRFKDGDVLDDDKKRMAKIKEALYGNETNVTDALCYKEGIVVPSNYERKS